MADSRGRTSFSSSTRSESVMPKTAGMITSSVIVWAAVRVRIVSPRRQLSISR
jgi:hypothetical protein